MFVTKKRSISEEREWAKNAVKIATSRNGTRVSLGVNKILQLLSERKIYKLVF